MISKGKRPQEMFVVCIYISPTEYYRAVIELEDWEWVGKLDTPDAGIQDEWEFKWSGTFLDFAGVNGEYEVIGSSKDDVYNKLIQLVCLNHLEINKG